jgi:hypothetical protein
MNRTVSSFVANAPSSHLRMVGGAQSNLENAPIPLTAPRVVGCAAAICGQAVDARARSVLRVDPATTYEAARRTQPANFGSIPHSDLLKSVARRIVDRRVLHLIKMWLEYAVQTMAPRLQNL